MPQWRSTTRSRRRARRKHCCWQCVPITAKTWDDDLITGILQETLELTKIRAVDLDSVHQVGQILPALYFALNLQGATISTNFATVKEFPRAVKLIRREVVGSVHHHLDAGWSRARAKDRCSAVFRPRYAIRCGF